MTQMQQHIVTLVRTSFVAAVFLMGSSVGHAEDTVRPGLGKTAKCESCHGIRGAAPLHGLIPKLCGQNKEYLAATLSQFQRGTRPQTIMHETTKKLSPALIKKIAAYFSKQSCTAK